MPGLAVTAGLAGCQPPERQPGQNVTGEEISAIASPLVTGAQAVKTEGVGQAETDPNSGTACTQPSNWRTPSGLNSFMPAMATAKAKAPF